MPHATQAVALVPHPATPSGAVRSIIVEVTRNPEALALRYVLAGELARLRVPPARPAARADGLWRHTCFEVFIAVSGSAGYVEFNFSPSGEWAAYRFSGYREGQAPLECAPPKFAARSSGEDLQLQAAVPAAVGPLRVACSAVVEDAAGSLSYWALRHPRARPDFHHAGGFVLELDEVRH
jgi:hypothetical protein